MATKEDLEKLKEMVMSLVGDIVEAKSMMDELKEWDSPAEWLANMQRITEIVQELAGIGKAAASFLDEVDDGDLASVLADILDDMIKLPFWMEPFDNIAFKMLIGMALAQYRKMTDDDDTPIVVEAKKLLKAKNTN